MKESFKNKGSGKKDILHRIREFPGVKPREDFLERLHAKIAELESGNKMKPVSDLSPAAEKSLTEKIKKFLSQYGKSYLVPAFGVLAGAFLLYYFIIKDSGNINKETITDKTIQEEKNNISFENSDKKLRSVLSESDRKKLDSILSAGQKKIELTAKDIEKTVRTLAEDNNRNINRLFAGFNKRDTSNTDTLSHLNLSRAGFGPDIDSTLNNKIEMINRYMMESLKGWK